MNWLRHRSGRSSAKRGVRGLFGAVIVAVVALTAILGGQRYFYCRAMDQIMTETTCCARAPVADEGRTAIGAFDDCLEVRFLDRLVSFTIGVQLDVPAAGLVAILPAPPPEMPPANAAATGAEHSIRAGPCLPSTSRAQLMVFLI